MHVCFCVLFVFHIPTVSIICFICSFLSCFLPSSLPQTSYQCLFYLSMGSVTLLFYCLDTWLPWYCLFLVFFILFCERLRSGFVNTPRASFVTNWSFHKSFKDTKDDNATVECFASFACQSATRRWQQPFSFTIHNAMKVSMLIKEHSWIYNDSNGDDS